MTVVRQFLGLPVGEVRFMRGVGKKTRDELISVLDRLRRRFPDEGKHGRAAERTLATAEDPATLDLDTLRRRLIDAPAKSKAAPTATKIRADFLGLEGAPHDWPTQADVAHRLGRKRQQVSQVLTADRDKWTRDRHVTALRDDLLRLIRSAGGVMALPELAEALVALRGTAQEEPGARARLASALVRVAYEAEQAKAEPKLHLRRSERGLLLAVTPELAEYAERLGEVADALAAEDPLPPSLRVFQRLYEVAPPEFPADCQPPNNDRILRLAAAASATAAVSTRQELYPRGLPARRALQLGLGALSGLEAGDADRKGERFDARSIRERIAARYPEAEPLPDGPVLEGLLREVGLSVVWDETTSTFHRPSRASVPRRPRARPDPIGSARTPGRDARRGTSARRWPRPASSRSGSGSRSATAPSSC